MRKYVEDIKILPVGDEYTSTQFDLYNPTATNYNFLLWNGYELTLTNTIPNPFFPYIVGSAHYNFFLQTIKNSPLMVRQIMLVSENTEQLNVPFNMVTKDANGDECIMPKLPNIYVSVNQYQPLISYIDFTPKELILDAQTVFSNYTVKANSMVRMVLFYKQARRGEFLLNHLSVCELMEFNSTIPNNRSYEQLEFQAQRPYIKPNWIGKICKPC